MSSAALQKVESWLRSALHRAPRILGSGALVALVTLLFLALVEGIASLAFVLGRPTEGVLLERSHTEFDSELGWINVPSLRVDDLYGPGLYLETNAQRFRNRRNFDRQVPTGKVRVVCTGDSFTLGYGVSNDDAWCELLNRKDARLETVNMGQGGYGIDQAYLWYRRGTEGLAHDALIFAFIATDFHRMMAETFAGYPKPVLAVENGKPVLRHKSSRLKYWARGIGQRLQPAKQLRILELWHRLRPASDAPVFDELVMGMPEGRELALAILEDARATAWRQKAAILVLLLPAREDYEHGSEVDDWLPFLTKELDQRGIPFLDLVTPMRAEPESLVRTFFRGHYNEIGNRWAADRIYDALVALPRVRSRLERSGPSPKSGSLLPAFLSRPVERVSLEGVHIRSNAMGDLAPLAIDGSMSTRWHSGAFQNGREEILLDLGKATSLCQVRLELGAWGYDYGRHLAVDVGEDEAHLVEVMNAKGTVAEVQVLAFPQSVSGRFLRIRQIDRSNDNFWSIAEISLFREAAK